MKTLYELDWRIESKTDGETLTHNHNRPVAVPPLGYIHLRSRWRLADEGQQSEASAVAAGATVPTELPGVQIELDDTAGRVWVFDPFATMPDFSSVRTAFAALYQRHLWVQESIKECLTSAGVAEWKDWIAKAVAEGSLREIETPVEAAPVEVVAESVAAPAPSEVAVVSDSPAVESAQADSAEPLPAAEEVATKAEPEPLKVRKSKAPSNAK